ncbi:BSD-domain-containing protein [Xylariaceae sp. FL0016]|nr:BSD-domain-containing protein [Xylariaceae sp. FL0016]
MDLAYDHIAEEALLKENNANNKDKDGQPQQSKPEQQSTLNEDLQDAYRAFSSSSWGTWIGGTVGKIAKQGENVYREASQEVSSLGVDASRGLANLRARAISLTTQAPPGTAEQQSGDRNEAETTPTAEKAKSTDESLQESETVLSRLRLEASKRLKDIQRAEDAADEALLKFGGNVRDFFRDAIVVSSSDASSSAQKFESKDDSGKRVIHTSRYDAQLHVLHTTEKSFTEDPATDEFGSWGEEFDVEKQTEKISADLAKYPELRANMEKLVPDTVPYTDFWRRYYFLRHSIDSADARRRDLLKAASAEEDVGWGEDSDDETEPSTGRPAIRPGSTESSTTIHPPVDKSKPKASEPRKSNDEKSQPDSDTSYDVVGAASGNPSQAPSSPKEGRKVEDDSDEEWE